MAFLSTRALLVFGVSMAVALHCAAAVSHTVGGASGWTIPTGSTLYTSWAANSTFKVGDTLVFNFATNAHNVLRVTQANYNSCTTTGALETYTTGPATVKLNDTGAHYYICGVPGHCSAGQKVAVTVSAATASPTPSPTPSPSSSPSPSTTPTPTATPTPSPSSSASPPTAPVQSPGSPTSTPGSPTSTPGSPTSTPGSPTSTPGTTTPTIGGPPSSAPTGSSSSDASYHSIPSLNAWMIMFFGVAAAGLFVL